jgi:hypothetical protein
MLYVNVAIVGLTPQFIDLPSTYMKLETVRFGLAVWSRGNASACGVMGREIESRQGVRRQRYKKDSDSTRVIIITASVLSLEAL